ncbi:MAG TPA: type II toxin-antitoxin system YhaV family toxin [Longimicrobium sp.]|jgi:toxin YhaV|uniref:type II toxin-antitoxin system YhaV family toxin n=1 Tax=Longimicrobium sp. TaxID=2029185 RepID=UPI002EDA0590
MPPSKGSSKSENSPAAEPGTDLLVVNDWRIGFHPALLLQLEKLISAVEKETRRHPDRPPASQPARILANLRQLMFVDVPQDPGREMYRHGGTLSKRRKHWFRARFGNGRYRLFFRYRLADRVLIFAWVNDERSPRTYGSSTDAYRVFAQKLDNDNPPDDWDALVKECSSRETIQKLKRILARMNGNPER